MIFLYVNHIIITKIALKYPYYGAFACSFIEWSLRFTVMGTDKKAKKSNLMKSNGGKGRYF